MAEGREFEIETQKENEIDLLKRVEATLFVAARFLSLQELNTLTGINPIMLRELLDKIKEKYDKEDSAMTIVEKEETWKMDVKGEYANIVTKLATGNAEFTRAEQETLAIIAYKQPIRQSVVVKIRGNKAYEHIKTFIKQGLVDAKKVAHTLELNLSPDFYDYFQINLGEKSEE
ncbi:SMC-Scp complex subunit ScpB [Candidatus Pacearchaeota archaeon]|nr:SMC-Scp complex subunit ScpB [Candidatus Pacearchaeota archaeon]